MELFPAASEEELSFIKRVIDDCDYYLLIVAGGYGSTGADGISYRIEERITSIGELKMSAVRQYGQTIRCSWNTSLVARFHRPDILLRCFVFRCMLSLNVLTQGAAA